MKKFVRSGIPVLLSAAVLLLYGCGGKGAKDAGTDLESVAADAAATFGDGTDAGAAYDADDFDSGDEGDTADWNGAVYQWSFEGDSAALNGKVTSIRLADTSCLLATTSDGGLFMLEPFIYFTQEDTEIKSYQITDDGGITDLAYANQHVAYGNHQFVYFDKTQDYGEFSMEDHMQAMESGSFSMPELVYTFEIVQKAELPGAQDLLMMTEDAAFCAYVDADNRVCVNYKDSSDSAYSAYSDVVFEGDVEGSDVTVSKSIFRFIVTDDQKLLFLRKGSVASDWGGTVQGVSLSCIDLTDKIGVRVRDIYNLLNGAECCYVVDDEQNIYFASVDMGDEVSVTKITQFDLGTITDIQGFAGTSENMLIGTEDGAYYYYDDDSYVTTRKIDALDGNYKNVALLMEGDVLALGNDGYLYVVENKN